MRQGRGPLYGGAVSVPNFRTWPFCDRRLNAVDQRFEKQPFNAVGEVLRSLEGVSLAAYADPYKNPCTWSRSRNSLKR
jgi:hypothetical protein